MGHSACWKKLQKLYSNKFRLLSSSRCCVRPNSSQGLCFCCCLLFFVFQNHFLDISFQPRFHLWWKALTKWQSYNFKFILWEEDEAAESKNLASWAGCWAEAKINKPSMHCEAAHEGRGPLSNTSGCYSGTLCWQPDHGGQIHCSAHECQKIKL